MSIFKSLAARLPGMQITPRTAVVKKPSKASIQTDAPDLDRLLVIPVSKEPREEQLRSYHFNQGQFLARQERWDDLSILMQNEDKQRHASDGGVPIAELLCQGARSDVVALAEHLLIDGTPEENRPLTEAISALEGILNEYPDNHVIATIVALAHLDIAWAWRRHREHT